MMTLHIKIVWLLSSLSVSALSFAADESVSDDEFDEQLEPITVEGEVYRHNTVKLLPEANSVMLDTATVLKKMPGAYVNQNGALSGIAQYRGLSGNRVNVNAAGTPVMTACSNAMDAPMSHVPASLVDAVVLQRGISPVSLGMETLGGSINVVPRSLNQSGNGFSGDLKLGLSSPGAGLLGAVYMQQQYLNHGFSLGVDVEQAENQEFPDGAIVFTGLEREYYSLGYQYNHDRTQVSIDVNYNDTGQTGTPSLPMDITYARGGITSVELATALNDEWQLTTQLDHQSTKHLMDNHRHRSQTMAGSRESMTRVKRDAVAVNALRTLSQQTLSWGIEWDQTHQKAEIFNPFNEAFQITNFDTERDRYSVFFEHQWQISQSHQLLTGLRWTHIQMDAADVFSSVAGMPSPMGQLHQTLQDRFNSADRSKRDHHLDLVINWQHNIRSGLHMKYGIAVKNRAPTHQERYLWLPLEATAGLADGRQYLGNLDLQSEQAIQFEWGLSVSGERFSIAPQVFYHHINDYIQGTPNETMPAPPGTLRYDNVAARLYGIDVEWSYRFSEQWTMNQVVSLVRGERRDIDDHLYRIAPLNSWLNLVYQSDNWQFETEWMAAWQQNRVSAANSESATSGYGVVNLSVDRTFGQHGRVRLAVNNLFDQLYYQHTNGYNRNNRNVDVGFDGSNLQAFRLPGQGRMLELNYFHRW
ncbi:TonB-dependent receptor [Marinicella sediminis]|uniref:TonB-dependent receptor n=1 Tax=Marinicella sediminis TaxID=1792834 RepID=A0ABV7J7C8_9GAMM|nr:TonB-dependent receptor [Marinicella sediminis]